ncbi:aldo/keto reductase [Streptomyces sp. A30]|uniref:aldo/keto reductase n=1 Tax=Streptomyces sp. A30 TaxID=2789273 RepID=UPI0039807FBB
MPPGRATAPPASRPANSFSAAGSICSSSSRRTTYNLRATEQLKELAAAKGITTAQLALAWLLAQGQDVEENAGADSVQLTDADLAHITEILPPRLGGQPPPGRGTVRSTTHR